MCVLFCKCRLFSHHFWLMWANFAHCIDGSARSARGERGGGGNKMAANQQSKWRPICFPSPTFTHHRLSICAQCRQTDMDTFHLSTLSLSISPLSLPHYLSPPHTTPSTITHTPCVINSANESNAMTKQLH